MSERAMTDRHLDIPAYPRRARYGLLGGYKTAPEGVLGGPRRPDWTGTAIRDMADRARARSNR